MTEYKRVTLKHGSARVTKDCPPETIEMLNILVEKAYNHVRKPVMPTITILNEWMKSPKSKICQCSNCDGYIYVNWLFDHMTHCMEQCPGCGKYKEFRVTKIQVDHTSTPPTL